MTTPRYSTRALIASLLALAFVAGVAVGVAADRLFAPGVRVRTIVGDMSGVFDRLRLTPEQRRQADAIVARSAPRSEAIMLDVLERLRAVADSVDAELRTILTPEQRLRLDSLKRDHRLVLKRKIVTPGGTQVDTLITGGAPPPRP
jgi:Spy/CpxP family protein refolding chaperone